MPAFTGRPMPSAACSRQCSWNSAVDVRIYILLKCVCSSFHLLDEEIITHTFSKYLFAFPHFSHSLSSFSLSLSLSLSLSIYLSIYLYIYVCVCVCMCVRMYIHKNGGRKSMFYIYIYIYIYIYGGVLKHVLLKTEEYLILRIFKWIHSNFLIIFFMSESRW